MLKRESLSTASWGLAKSDVKIGGESGACSAKTIKSELSPSSSSSEPPCGGEAGDPERLPVYRAAQIDENQWIFETEHSADAGADADADTGAAAGQVFFESSFGGHFTKMHENVVGDDDGSVQTLVWEEVLPVNQYDAFNNLHPAGNGSFSPKRNRVAGVWTMPKFSVGVNVGKGLKVAKDLPGTVFPKLHRRHSLSSVDCGRTKTTCCAQLQEERSNSNHVNTISKIGCAQEKGAGRDERELRASSSPLRRTHSTGSMSETASERSYFPQSSGFLGDPVLAGENIVFGDEAEKGSDANAWNFGSMDVESMQNAFRSQLATQMLHGAGGKSKTKTLRGNKHAKLDEDMSPEVHPDCKGEGGSNDKLQALQDHRLLPPPNDRRAKPGRHMSPTTVKMQEWSPITVTDLTAMTCTVSPQDSSAVLFPVYDSNDSVDHEKDNFVASLLGQIAATLGSQDSIKHVPGKETGGGMVCCFPHWVSKMPLVCKKRKKEQVDRHDNGVNDSSPTRKPKKKQYTAL